MSRRQLEHPSLIARRPQQQDLVYNPYCVARSPLKNQRGLQGHSPTGVSPSRSQGFTLQQKSGRKQSIKKGLFQIEIEKQNKENQHSNILLSHGRSKPQLNMFAKVIKGLSPRSSTPTRAQLFPASNCPSISSFLQGEKLSFKRISCQSRQSEGHQRKISQNLSEKVAEQPPQVQEYQLPAALLENSKQTTAAPSSFQMSFAKQHSVEEPPRLNNKESLKTASTIEQPKQQLSSIHPKSQIAPARDSHNDSLWSSNDRVNISQQDSMLQLNMSPYFN